MRKMNWLLLFGTLSALSTIAILIIQQQGSKNDKEEIMNQLYDVRNERDTLRKDLAQRDARIDRQANEIIELNRELVKKSEKLNDFITGGDGYPLIRIDPIQATNPTADGSFRFELRNDTDLPLYSIRAQITDYEQFKRSLKTNAEGSLTITTTDQQNAILYLFDDIRDLTPNSSIYSASQFRNPNGLYVIQIKSLNRFVFEKLAIVSHNNTAYWGYAIFDDKKRLIYSHFSYEVPDKIKDKIRARLKEIDFEMKYRLMY